jgi:XTP/dITP diphosphohydrolase
MNLYFISHNLKKQEEIQKIIGEKFKILNLNDLKITEDIPENELTFEGNAKAKIEYILQKNPEINCFSDDSGLVVESLNGAPGVFSARYAGENKNDQENINLLLSNLENITNRKAYFITVISLYFNQKFYFFEGKVEGNIIMEKRGILGFGYDPIFVPENSYRTFAEMALDEKNKYSHRSIALKKMLHFLKFD